MSAVMGGQSGAQLSPQPDRQPLDIAEHLLDQAMRTIRSLELELGAARQQAEAYQTVRQVLGMISQPMMFKDSDGGVVNRIERFIKERQEQKLHDVLDK